MELHLLDLMLDDAAANLALDEALLLEAEVGRGSEVLRLWELPSYAAVVGAGGSVANDVNRDACSRDGVPILRRGSGGGTVLLGPGCLCYSLVLRTDRAPGLDLIQPATRYVLRKTLNAIAAIVPGLVTAGTSDLAAGGFKLSGNAQQRKQRYFLHHGTLLAGFDLDRMTRYLNAPEHQPDYRGGRPHRDFVGNLGAATADLKRLLIAEWQPQGDCDPPLERVRELVADKYSQESWNLRR